MKDTSYSRDMQDIFVINFLKNKEEGTYLEIGAADHKEGNNTYLLEKNYNWKGISFEIQKKYEEEWVKNRTNKCYYIDATTADYSKLLLDNDMPNIIDYLQLDCDPPIITFNILKRIPFDKFKFRVITFEHDQYNSRRNSEDWQIKGKARSFLESKGYVLLADDISAKGFSDKPFEDWYVNKTLVDKEQFKKWKSITGRPKECTAYVNSKIKKRKIIFHNDLAIGDTVVMTCAIRDFKLMFPEIEIDVRTNFDFIFNNNPYLTPLNPNDSDVEYYKVLDPLTNNKHIGWMSYSSAFLLDMISQVDLYERLPIKLHEFTAMMNKGFIGHKLNIDEKFNKQFSLSNNFYKDFLIKNKEKFKEIKKLDVSEKGLKLEPDLHLTEEQKNNKEEFLKKHNLPQRYWVIAAGGKKDCTSKIYDWKRVDEAIKEVKQNERIKDLQFIQIGQSNHQLQFTIKLNNTLNYIDKFKQQELLELVYHSEGVITQVSLLLHLAGAFNKPCVAIYGGREDDNFAAYKGQVKLSTIGLLDCCKVEGCWLNECNNLNENGIQKCMDMITSEDIVRGIKHYYR